jgi:hypothetical protein
MVFGRCVENKWHGETIASTEKKAKSNLTYQWKKRNNKVAGTKVTLPGKVQILEEVYYA